MIWERSKLRDYMIREKNFLSKLYVSKTASIAKKAIVNANDQQITLLIQVLHYIARGMGA